MSFYIPETTKQSVPVTGRSQSSQAIAEKELPDAFLRRCIFHFIEFPTPQLMEQIVEVHFPNLRNTLLKEAMKAFYALREIDDFRKKPSTSELVDWIRVLIASETPADSISKELPFTGALLKKEVDQDYFVNNYLILKAIPTPCAAVILKLLIDFFYTLRKRKGAGYLHRMDDINGGHWLKVKLMTSTSFIFVARAILVKSEAYFDHYDVAFQGYFKGVEQSRKLHNRYWTGSRIR